MDLPDLRHMDFTGKNVLMRVDFNVEFDYYGEPKGQFKIKAAKESIDFINNFSGVKVALLSHLGRPGGVRQGMLSFDNCYKKIGDILGVNMEFVDKSVGPKVESALKSLKNGNVLMLENIRFHRQDEENDLSFSKLLSNNFDIFVNEAFGAAHRNHASLTRIADFLPSFAGFTFRREVSELVKIRNSFAKPAVAIIGGAKIETKLPVIEFFASRYHAVLLGGKMGLEIEEKGLSLPDNVILPMDYLKNNFDIGNKTVEEFAPYIKEAKTIVWNGPLGYFEDPKYSQGTLKVLNLIKENIDAYKLAGGGETLQVLEETGSLDKFNFVSTGGGAMLELLAKGHLPAADALFNSKKEIWKTPMI